jgi:hypothetical protein
MVDGGGVGSGLASVRDPRVAFGLSWIDRKTLVVEYPNDLSLEDDWKDTFGLGGYGRAIYMPASREAIAPMHWTVTAELKVVSEKKLTRGHLTTMTISGTRLYDYSYYDSAEPDSSVALLESWGLQAGGETWAGIVVGLIAPTYPKVMAHLDLDPEADGIAIRSSKRAHLMLVADRIAEAKQDPEILKAAVECARRLDRIE